MNDADLSKRLYRAILSVVLDDELSTEDLRRLADIINGKRLSQAVSEAIHLIAEGGGQSSSRNSARSEKGEARKVAPRSEATKRSNLFLSSADMFDLIKRRKISKVQLLKIINDIDSRSIPSAADEMTVREIVQTFYSNSDPDDQNLLRKIVSGDFSGDPFLQGMSSR